MVWTEHTDLDIDGKQGIERWSHSGHQAAGDTDILDVSGADIVWYGGGFNASIRVCASHDLASSIGQPPTADGFYETATATTTGILCDPPPKIYFNCASTNTLYVYVVRKKRLNNRGR